MIDLSKAPTYVDDSGRTVIGERPPPHIARLSAAIDETQVGQQVTVDRADLRALMRDLSEARVSARLAANDADETQALLAADAGWRTRADDEPVRSIVAELLGAAKRTELLPQETPLQLAKSVVALVRQLRRQLRREYAYEHVPKH